MANITVNGSQREFEVLPTTIEALLTALNLSPKGLIVEKNGEIFREGAFKTTPVWAEDTREIVQFMGGGTAKNRLK